MENERLMSVLSTNAVSRASLIAHPAIDIGNEQESVMRTLHALRGCVPYLTKGSTLEDEMAQEREALIDEYKKYVRSLFDTDEEYEEFMRKRKNG